MSSDEEIPYTEPSCKFHVITKNSRLIVRKIPLLPANMNSPNRNINGKRCLVTEEDEEDVIFIKELKKDVPYRQKRKLNDENIADLLCNGNSSESSDKESEEEWDNQKSQGNDCTPKRIKEIKSKKVLKHESKKKQMNTSEDYTTLQKPPDQLHKNGSPLKTDVSNKEPAKSKLEKWLESVQHDDFSQLPSAKAYWKLRKLKHKAAATSPSCPVRLVRVPRLRRTVYSPDEWEVAPPAAGARSSPRAGAVRAAGEEADKRCDSPRSVKTGSLTATRSPRPEAENSKALSPTPAAEAEADNRSSPQALRTPRAAAKAAAEVPEVRRSPRTARTPRRAAAESAEGRGSSRAVRTPRRAAAESAEGRGSPRAAAESAEGHGSPWAAAESAEGRGSPRAAAESAGGRGSPRAAAESAEGRGSPRAARTPRRAAAESAEGRGSSRAVRTPRRAAAESAEGRGSPRAAAESAEGRGSPRAAAEGAEGHGSPWAAAESAEGRGSPRAAAESAEGRGSPRAAAESAEGRGSPRAARTPRRAAEDGERGRSLSYTASQGTAAAAEAALPGRERELGALRRFIGTQLADGAGGCLYVSGVPGTGKTASVRAAVASLRALEAAGDLPCFQFVELNGLQMPQPRRVYPRLWAALAGKQLGPDAALSRLDRWFGAAGGRAAGDRPHLVLLLDEVDALQTRRQDVLYNLLDWPGRRSSRFTLIAIANTMDLPERTLKTRVNSRMGLTRLTFQPYSFQQLQLILASRLPRASTFEPEALEFIARKVASLSGDARRALEAGRRAAELAAEAGAGSVRLEHASQALAAAISPLAAAVAWGLSELQRLVLAALESELTARRSEEATLGQLQPALMDLCALSGLRPAPSGPALALACTRLAALRLVLAAGAPGPGLRLRLNLPADEVLAGAALRRQSD